MIQIKGLIHSLAAMFLIFTFTGGCASMGPTIPPGVKPVGPEAGVNGNGWWEVRFQMKWPEDTEASWHVDLFLALEVVSPVLDQYRKDIILWRFHRRAHRDQTGHQFSFIFYCHPTKAQQIYDAIKSDVGLAEMKTAGIIIKEGYDDTGRILRPRIEDTSGSAWPRSIKKSWPYFIMGVSQMWLDLITEIAEQNSDGQQPLLIEERLAFYEQVNASVTEVWREQGQRAFLHHLNALFGYEPVAIYEKRYMKF